MNRIFEGMTIAAIGAVLFATGLAVGVTFMGLAKTADEEPVPVSLTAPSFEEARESAEFCAPGAVRFSLCRGDGWNDVSLMESELMFRAATECAALLRQFN